MKKKKKKRRVIEGDAAEAHLTDGRDAIECLVCALAKMNCYACGLFCVNHDVKERKKKKTLLEGME
jgi:Pyruvate/2-oxoacid:ferredoxin oxidoreductase delta subunit